MTIIKIWKFPVILAFIPKDVQIRVALSFRSFFILFSRPWYVCFRHSHAAHTHSVQSRLDGRRLPRNSLYIRYKMRTVSNESTHFLMSDQQTEQNEQWPKNYLFEFGFSIRSILFGELKCANPLGSSVSHQNLWPFTVHSND